VVMQQQQQPYMQQPTGMMPMGVYGTHAAMSTMTYGDIKVYGRAEFADYFCSPFSCSCCFDKSRIYFQVLENAYESNVAVESGCCCAAIGSDFTSKVYFDRGVFDQQGCARVCGCLRGTPLVYAGEVQNVCCCMDCPSWLNCCANGYYMPGCCGERARVLPADTICCCCGTRSNVCTNCFGLCGPKTGEPLCLLPLVGGLREGTSQH